MRAAAVQLNSQAEVDRNLEVAERLVREAAADGAELIVLPEKWNVLGSAEALRASAEPIDGPTLTAASGWAGELGVALVAGSITERVEGAERLANTSVLFDREGRLVATYRKIHLFDVDVGGVSYRESDTEAPGEEIVLGELDHRGAPLRIGLSVCYDLRFPELYRILTLRGARVIVAPSAFTMPTGSAHWDVLVRARAIENQAFVIASGQTGKAPPHYESWGHSAIVDPWGRVLAQSGTEVGFIAADLDLSEQEHVRETLPSLANRRPESYRWPELVETSS